MVGSELASREEGSLVGTLLEGVGCSVCGYVCEAGESLERFPYSFCKWHSRVDRGNGLSMKRRRARSYTHGYRCSALVSYSRRNQSFASSMTRRWRWCALVHEGGIEEILGVGRRVQEHISVGVVVYLACPLPLPSPRLSARFTTKLHAPSAVNTYVNLTMLAAVFIAAFVGSAAAADSCSNSLKVSYPAPVAADGWSYRLVANGFIKPRGILFDTDGALIVVDSGAGIFHLALTDDGGTCVSVDKQTTLVESEEVTITSTHPHLVLAANTSSSTMALPSPRMAKPSTPRRLTRSTAGPTRATGRPSATPTAPSCPT